MFDAERAYIGIATVGVNSTSPSVLLVITILVSSTLSSVEGTNDVILADNPNSSDFLSISCHIIPAVNFTSSFLSVNNCACCIADLPVTDHAPFPST